jgi:nucleolar protein 56
VTAPGTHDAALLRRAVLELARRDVKAMGDQADRYVAHAVRVMDELTASMNTLVERLREWYGLYDPEGARAVPDQSDFAKRVAEGAFDAKDPMGMEMDEAQRAAIVSYAAAVRDCYAQRAELEKAVAVQVQAVAPTLSALVGDFVAARLIALAGSLERLAFLPASTIQTLGAETALFAHIRQGKDPPKHGVLFQHHWVNTAAPQQRGRVARTLAGKAALAARLDHFGTGSAEAARPLMEAVTVRIAAIKAAPARPRVPPTRAPRPARPRGRK